MCSTQLSNSHSTIFAAKAEMHNTFLFAYHHHHHLVDALQKMLRYQLVKFLFLIQWKDLPNFKKFDQLHMDLKDLLSSFTHGEYFQTVKKK